MKGNKKNETQKRPEEKKWVKCEAFGSRCTICGTYFDDDVCNHGHVHGHSYQF